MFTIDLTGRNAIITGAGSGLAKQCALSLADCGANVAVADINLKGAEETAAEITGMGPKALAVQCDVAQRTDVEAVFKAAKAQLGSIDIVVNAAGIGPWTRMDTATEEEFRRILDINLMGVEFGSREALLAMQEQGHGRVVNFASVAAWLESSINPHYAVSKAAVVSLTRQYARHAAPLGINYNSMCPGIIRTPMWEAGLATLTKGGDKAARDALWEDKILKMIPMGIPQEPIDIANAVVFLVSDQARYITGQALNVDGGQFMH